MVLLVICMVIFSLFILRSNIKTARLGEINQTTVLIRIMTNYIQLISLVQSLNLDWPSFVDEVYSGQDRVSSSSDQVFNFDCISTTDTPNIYFRLVFICLLPIPIMILVLVMWTIIKFLLKMPWPEIRYRIRGTITNLLFLIHPVIIKTCLLMYSCIEIENTYYLDSYMEDECWTGDHYYYVVTVTIPALIVWGIGLPVTAWYMLFRNKKSEKLYTKRKIMIKYGFLYLGYRSKVFWWELVILVRRICVLVVIVWLRSISPRI